MFPYSLNDFAISSFCPKMLMRERDAGGIHLPCLHAVSSIHPCRVRNGNSKGNINIRFEQLLR